MRPLPRNDRPRWVIGMRGPRDTAARPEPARYRSLASYGLLLAWSVLSPRCTLRSRCSGSAREGVEPDMSASEVPALSRQRGPAGRRFGDRYVIAADRVFDG